MRNSFIEDMCGRLTHMGHVRKTLLWDMFGGLYLGTYGEESSLIPGESHIGQFRNDLIIDM